MPLFEKQEDRFQRLLRESIGQQASLRNISSMRELSQLPPQQRIEQKPLYVPFNDITEITERKEEVLESTGDIVPRSPIAVTANNPKPLATIKETVNPFGEDVEWWEKPKVIGEDLMGKVGEAISKVPILPDALKFVTPVFEFIHEEIEKPWAAIVTAPWSPDIPWNRGESWLDHEKRAYDAWKAPTYIKGAAEFSMPLWWLPWLKIGTSGVRALGAGNKMAQFLAKQPIKPLSLPSNEVLNASLYKGDIFKKIALWAENKPGLHKMAKIIGGDGAFRRDIGEVFPLDDVTKGVIAVDKSGNPVALTDVVRQAVLNNGVIYDMRHGYRGLQLPRMQKWGNATKTLQVDDFGRVLAATPKPIPARGGLPRRAVSETADLEIVEQAIPGTGYRSLEAFSRTVRESTELQFRELADTVVIDSITSVGGKPSTLRELLRRVVERNPGKRIVTTQVSASGRSFINRLRREGVIETERLTAAEAAEFTIRDAIGRSTFTRPLAIRVKKGFVDPVHPAHPGIGMSDVFENPELYTYSSKAAENIVKEGKAILDELAELAAKEGIVKHPKISFHRMVEGKFNVPGDTATYEASEWGSRFEMARHHLTMEEGIAIGVKYGRDPLQSIAATVDYTFSKIAQKRLNDVVSRFGKTIPEMISLSDPLLAEQIKGLSVKLGSISHMTKALKTVRATGGKRVPGATLSKIKRGLGEYGERIEQAYSVAPDDLGRVIDAMGRDILKASKLDSVSMKLGMKTLLSTPDLTVMRDLIRKGNFEGAIEFFTKGGASQKQITKFVNTLKSGTLDNPAILEDALGQVKHLAKRIRASDIERYVIDLNLSNAITTKAISGAYKAVYQSRKQFVDDALKVIRRDIDGVASATKSELNPLKAEYKKLADYFREGQGQIFGGYGKIGRQHWDKHPAFKQRIFSNEISKFIDKQLGDSGQEWLRNAANISGTGRLLIGALDFSAGFIQGLAVLGRNPVAWAKAMGQQFNFFTNPSNLYKYLDDPITRSISSERWFYGGSRSSFEFFEALRPMQELAGKLPKVGGAIQKGIQQSYGRAEAAFTGFGEVARNEMWKAMRYKAVKKGTATAVNPLGVLDDRLARDVSRTIDRMTGVMSTEAIAIGKSLRISAVKIPPI
jgi:hypothetical protein